MDTQSDADNGLPLPETEDLPPLLEPEADAPTPEADDAAPAPANADAEAPMPTYVLQTWSGIPQYVCLACGASTLDFAPLTEHLRQRHGLTPVEEIPEPSFETVPDVEEMPTTEYAEDLPSTEGDESLPYTDEAPLPPPDEEGR